MRDRRFDAAAANPPGDHFALDIEQRLRASAACAGALRFDDGAQREPTAGSSSFGGQLEDIRSSKISRAYVMASHPRRLGRHVPRILPVSCSAWTMALPSSAILRFQEKQTNEFNSVECRNNA